MQCVFGFSFYALDCVCACVSVNITCISLNVIVDVVQA